jgi:hypothetical protein
MSRPHRRFRERPPAPVRLAWQEARDERRHARWLPSPWSLWSWPMRPPPPSVSPQRSVYALIRRYQPPAGFGIPCTCSIPRGRGKAGPRCRGAYHHHYLAERHLTRQKLKAEDVVDDIRRGCLAAGLCPPSRYRPCADPPTARGRSGAVAEGREAARRVMPVRAAFRPSAPIADSSDGPYRGGLIVVDEQSRCPIGRPISR